MGRGHEVDEKLIEIRVPQDWVPLLRKLRWIGLEDEAKRLEFTLSSLPPEQRCGATFGPFSTD